MKKLFRNKIEFNKITMCFNLSMGNILKNTANEWAARGRWQHGQGVERLEVYAGEARRLVAVDRLDSNPGDCQREEDHAPVHHPVLPACQRALLS